MRYLKLSFYIQLLLTLSMGGIQAQEISFDDLAISTYLEANEKEIGNVRDIVKGPEGFIWLATSKGIIRYDGEIFRRFDLENTASFRGEFFTNIEVYKGQVLVIERSGVYVFNDLTFVDYLPNRQFELDAITHLAIHGDDQLFYVRNRRLYKVADGEMTEIQSFGEEVIGVYEGIDGAIWLFNGEGRLIKIKNGSVLVELQLDDYSTVSTLIEFEEGKLLYSKDLVRGITLYDGQRIKPFMIEEHRAYLSEISVSEFKRTDDGDVYFSSNYGLHKWNGEEIETFQQYYGQGQRRLTSVYLEGDRIWLGREQGLTKLEYRGYRHLLPKTANRQASVITTALIETNVGEYLVGLNGSGLVKATDNDWIPLSNRDILGEVIYSLYQNEKGIYVGSNDGAFLAQLDGNQIRLIRQLGDEVTYYFQPYDDEKFLVSSWSPTTGERVYLMDESGEKKFIENQVNLRVNWHQITENGLLIGSRNGVYLYRNDELELLDEKKGVPVQRYSSIFYNSNNGNAWMGSIGSGIVLMTTDSVQVFNTQNGFPTNEISSIMTRDERYFYVADRDGIFMLDAERISQNSSSSRLSFDYLYNKFNTTTTNIGFPNAIINSEGKLLYASRLGVVQYDPTFESQDEVIVLPEFVRIEDASKKNGRIIIPAGRSGFEIDYTVINFDPTRQTSFEYKLEGYDDDWIKAGQRRTAFYTSLPAGDYKFKLRVIDSLGNVIESQKEIEFTKKQYWYLLWPMRLLYLLALIILIRLFYVRRLASIRRQNTRLNKLVDHKTKELQELNASLEDKVIERTSELTNLNKDLTESEERFRKVIDGSTNGMILVKDDGEIVMHNASAAQTFGYESGGLDGMKIEELVPKRTTKEHATLRKSYYSDRRKRFMGKDADLTARRRDGSEIPVQVGLSPLKIKRKNYTLAVIVDMTERVKSEQAIKEREEQLRYALEASEDGIFDWNLDDERIMFSPALYNMLGFEDREFDSTAKEIDILIHPDDKFDHSLNAYKSKAQSGDHLFDDEFRMLRKDGSAIWVRLQAKVVESDLNSNPTRLVGTIANITEQKRKAQEILDAILATEDNERSRISKEIHDGLQQMLTITALNLSMAKKESDKLGERAKEKFETGWEYLQNSIAESRSVAHRMMPKAIVDYGLVSACESLIDEINESADDTIFQFQHNFGDDRIPNSSLEVSFYRILQESLNNIIKYAKAKKVLVQLKKYDDILMMTIEDDGVGFDTKNVKAGFGIKGMQNRIGAIGGSIDIESTPGRGTMVTVQISNDKILANV